MPPSSRAELPHRGRAHAALLAGLLGARPLLHRHLVAAAPLHPGSRTGLGHSAPRLGARPCRVLLRRRRRLLRESRGQRPPLDKLPPQPQVRALVDAREASNHLPHRHARPCRRLRLQRPDAERHVVRARPRQRPAGAPRVLRAPLPPHRVARARHPQPRVVHARPAVRGVCGRQHWRVCLRDARVRDDLGVVEALPPRGVPRYRGHARR
mmetsp:Transcript_27401/g.80587  ORF Transcript_27401/g.80587 Transcript_27401/m.80587 type:complete len:210 (-) Transcript_27401:555-1184(-)